MKSHKSKQVQHKRQSRIVHESRGLWLDPYVVTATYRGRPTIGIWNGRRIYRWGLLAWSCVLGDLLPDVLEAVEHEAEMDVGWEGLADRCRELRKLLVENQTEPSATADASQDQTTSPPPSSG